MSSMVDFLERILRFKHHLRPVCVEGERVFLIGEREQFMLSGRVQTLVASRLDGRCTIRELLTLLEHEASAPELYASLSRLEEAGFLVDALPEYPTEAAAFWHAAGTAPQRATQRLGAVPVAVQVLGDLDAAPLVQALGQAGVRVQADAPFRVVMVSDYLEPDLEELNRQALASGVPWMPLKLVGVVAWIGPVLRPWAGPCWECLAHRLRNNRSPQTFLQGRGLTGPLFAPRAALPLSVQAAACSAALALSQWLAEGGQGRLGEALLAQDLARFESQWHTVVRRPQCPTCGEPERMRAWAQRPLLLKPSPKRFTEDGGHRCMPPQATLARLEHHVSPITGLVGGLSAVPGQDHPLRPVFQATLPVPSLEDVPAPGDFQVTAFGKGSTPVQARTSALCEALERYSARFQGDEPRRRARMHELQGEAIHPHALMNFSEAQYARGQAPGVRARDTGRLIPPPFDESAKLDWTPVWSLTHERRRYLPTAYCYACYPAPPGERFCVQDFNGHASGNCLEEAILQGFLELAERDAVAVWWYNRLARPAVALQRFGNPYFQALGEHYQSLGWRLWVLDLTHDLGIPTFAALGRSLELGWFRIGFGAHLDAGLAIQRALTELNQVFDPRHPRATPWDVKELGEVSFLLPDETLGPRTPEDFPTVGTEDLQEDVRLCVQRAAGAGLETLVLDQTRPDVGLCAVKVVVPGLRHFWPRFGPGRLYEVPLRQGWLSSPLAESQLNPLPLLL